MTMLISIDVALSGAENADYCAYVVYDGNNIVHIERHRGLRYDEIVSRAVGLRDWLGQALVVIDASGNGRAVWQALHDRIGDYAVGVQIVGSRQHATTLSPAGLVHISKMQALRDFASAIQTGKIKIAAGMPLAKELVQEAASLSTKASRTGRLIVSEPDKKYAHHDDLILAAAQAMPVMAALQRQAG